MPILDFEQGTEQWIRARVGSLGASSVSDVLARTRTGWGAGRKNTMARLIAERLTGEPSDNYVSAAMQHGIDTEAEARAAYAFFHDAEVTQVGLITHPEIARTHASPDGLVGADGLVEIKCPNTATHIDTLLGQKIPAQYETQMLWQMICAERSWCDFCSYDPRLSGDMQLFVRRVHFDEARAEEMQKEICVFLAELDAKLEKLKALYGAQEAG